MDSLFSLAGKKAVITGCATGIGKGMAAGLEMCIRDRPWTVWEVS